MNIIQCIALVCLITLFIKLLLDYKKEKTSKENFQYLYNHLYEFYTPIFDAIYETKNVDNQDGTVTCKYSVKENLKELFPTLKPEYLICTLKKEDFEI